MGVSIADYFEEVATETGVALPEQGNAISGMGVDFRDLNNDGFPDIVLAALQDETFPIYQNNRDGGSRISRRKVVWLCSAIRCQGTARISRILITTVGRIFL
jgi:hypothetical protein